MRLLGTTIVARVSSIPEATVGPEVVLLNTEQGRYHGFNAIAATIWKHLEEPISVQALCAALTTQFDVSPDQCEHDVLSFLEELREHRLLVIHRP